MEEMVADLANGSWDATVALHLLLSIADTSPPPCRNTHACIITLDLDVSITARLPSNFHADLLHYVDLYIGNLITLVQGVPADRNKTCGHVFASIGWVFRPNMPCEHSMQDPNLLKNIKKGDVSWNYQKRFLGSILDTLILTVFLLSLWLQQV